MCFCLALDFGIDNKKRGLITLFMHLRYRQTPLPHIQVEAHGITVSINFYSRGSFKLAIFKCKNKANAFYLYVISDVMLHRQLFLIYYNINITSNPYFTSQVSPARIMSRREVKFFLARTSATCLSISSL